MQNMPRSKSDLDSNSVVKDDSLVILYTYNKSLVILCKYNNSLVTTIVIGITGIFSSAVFIVASVVCVVVQKTLTFLNMPSAIVSHIFLKLRILKENGDKKYTDQEP